MIPELDFIKAEDFSTVLKMLAQPKNKTRVIAGGTDILAGFHQQNRRFQNIKTLIDISNIKEIRSIRKQNKRLHIGSAVTFSEIIKNPLLNQKYPLLVKAATSIGSMQIRNRATIAGNFVNNAPCADSVPPLLVYDAAIRIKSLNSEREILLSDFLVKPYQTQLQPTEVVTEIVLPDIDDEFKGTFYKLGKRRDVAISRITLAFLVKRNVNKIEAIQIASGAVTPIGIRFLGLEQKCHHQTISCDFLKELAIELGKQILKISGLRWSTVYKLPVVQQLFYQQLYSILYRQ